ncbi:MAG: hypothetical protein L3J82_06150 [Planctomycetes bacterium]|nr:hypothetical protein [Planctomycetota bacterium]
MPDYITIFEVLGQYARAFGTLENLANRDLKITSGGETIRSLDKLQREFIDVLNDSASERAALQPVEILSDASRAVEAWKQQLHGALDRWITKNLAEELGFVSTDKQKILLELRRQMLSDSKTVKVNSVALNSVSAASTNVGNAALLAGIKTVNDSETILNNELISDATIDLRCVQDAVHDRLPEGHELFRSTAGDLRIVPVTIGDFTDARNVITDGAFDKISGSDFAHWAKISGGSVASQETSDVQFGTGALKITGDAATALDLQQDLKARDPSLPSGQFYGLGAWIKVSTYSAGSVTIDLLIDGVASTEILTIDASIATGSWLHVAVMTYLARSVYPNKVKVRIRCSSTFNGTVLIDGLTLAPATKLGKSGINAILFQGVVAPQSRPVADRYGVDTSSDDAGSFQTFLRDELAVIMPSSASPTVSETLAE